MGGKTGAHIEFICMFNVYFIKSTKASCTTGWHANGSQHTDPENDLRPAHVNSLQLIEIKCAPRFEVKKVLNYFDWTDGIFSKLATDTSPRDIPNQ